MAEKKITLGLIEEITIIKKNGKEKKIKAKIDTGASKCSLDINLAAAMELGPVIKTKMVKSAEGKSLRPVIKAEIIISGRKIKTEFTLADRKELKYNALIGINALSKYFLIDPSKNSYAKKKKRKTKKKKKK